MKGIQAVTDLAVYIQRNVPDTKVFKYEKSVNYKGNYICVNKLPTAFGSMVNDTTILNVNVHVQDKTDQRPDTKALEELTQKVAALIPYKNVSTEDDERELIVHGAWFAIESDSNLLKDTDGTHFINLRIQVTFTN